MRIKTFLVVIFLMVAAQARATDYYVSPSGSGTTCSKASPCATTGVPWTTLETGTTNHTVYLMGGTYNTTLAIRHRSITNTLYIRPCSAAPDATGCDSQVVMTRGTNYPITLDALSSNITLSGETTIGGGTRNIKVVPGNGHGIAATWAALPVLTNIKIQYLEFTGLDDGTVKEWGTANKSIYCMNFIYGVGVGSEISYNYFYDNWGHSEISGKTAKDQYGILKIHHNTFVRGTANCISIPGGIDVYNNIFDLTENIFPYDVLHSYNAISDANEKLCSGGPCPAGVRYIRFYNNYVDTNDQAVFLENSSTTACDGGPCKTEKIRIYNNLFKCSNPKTEGAVFFGGRSIMLSKHGVSGGNFDDIAIVNNTFINNQYGIFLGPAATYTNTTIENNIFYEASSATQYTGSAAMTGISGNTTSKWGADVIFDHNLLYDNDTMQTQWLNGVNGTMTTYTSLSAFVTAWAGFDGNVNTTPTFVNTTDYRLAEGSQGIDAGADLSALTNMGAGWPNDKDGNTRSGSWDIGAYEYGGSADTTPPTITTATINVDGDVLTLVFSEVVTVNTSTGFTLGMSGGAAGLTYTSGSGTNILVYAITGRNIDTAETGTLDYATVANGIEDAAGNDLASTGESDISVTNNSTYSPSATTYTVTVQSSGDCIISPFISKIIVSGETASYTCTAVGNSGCAAWTGTCGGTGTTSFTSSAITSDCTVIQGCYKIAPDVAIGSGGAAVTLGTGASGTLY